MPPIYFDEKNNKPLPPLPVFDDVNVSLCDEKYIKNNLPLVITPKGQNTSLEFLTRFCESNRAVLNELLIQWKVILFRGFNVQSPQDFEHVALSCEPHLNDLYHGTSPRDSITQYVFTASELPNFFPIPQHLEMSFLPSMPKRLFFFCQTEPASGGETPLCDYAAVWRDLDPDLKYKFRTRGVRYIRNYAGPKQWRLDPTQLKPWPDIYRTLDKAKVESDSLKDDVRPEWGKGDALRLTNDRPAFLTHPVTGEEVWANHSQIFHPATAHQEYARIARRTGQLKFWFWVVVAWLLFTIKSLILSEQQQSMNTLFGDGSSISEKEMSHVRDTIWKHTVFNPWRKGDVTMIDNLQCSHGRQPYGGKQRRILVAWA